MTGRHKAPGRGRLISEIFRLGVIVLLLFVVLVGGAVLISRWLSDSDDTIPISGSSTSSTAEATSTTGTSATTAASSATTIASGEATTTTAATTSSEATTTTVETTTTTEATPRPPSEVTVLVLNSTTRNFLAARVTEDLAALGYVMLEPTNYRPTLSTSAVWYAPGFGLEAFELAAQFPDANVEPFPGDDAEADIVVVLGASFSG